LLILFSSRVRSAVPIAGRIRRAGTHGYLPPETYRGQTADPALDLWALSVVLLEAMVSRNVLAGAIGGRRMHRAVQAHLAWACASQPQTLAAFTSFFERALNSDPAVRFQTMDEMQVAFETLIAACGDEKTPSRQSSSTCADVR
jgi:serine/threonine protein kinase